MTNGQATSTSVPIYHIRPFVTFLPIVNVENVISKTNKKNTIIMGYCVIFPQILNANKKLCWTLLKTFMLSFSFRASYAVAIITSN